MSKGKRIGYGVLSLLPLLFMLLIQVLGGQIIYAAVTVYMSMQPGMDPAMLNDIVYTYFMEHYTGVLVLIQGVTLLVFGCWYYLGFTRKKERGTVKNLLHIHNLAGIFLLSVGIYFFITLFLVAADHLVPDIMDEYNMLMEESGIVGLTLLSSIVTLVMAPLGEELIFRGLTLQYLRKAGLGFHAANIIQAILFGIAHMNWIQGIYAFLLGLILGWLCKRFKTLAAPMLLHMFFNFSGTYIAALIDPLPENIWLYLFLFASFSIFTFLGIKVLGKAPLYQEKTI